VPRIWGENATSQRIPPPFDWKLTIGTFILNANDLIALILAPIAMVAVALFLGKTRLGTAVRGAAEQSERAVYELVDLRFGPCVMIFATTAGDDRAAEALRRLGVMRVATKYPRIARRHFDRTGRQAEIVEVKGSVELAPLTGLVEGIVDLTATGTTLRENGLVVREEILASTARLIANPVAHKLRAAEIDDVVARVREALA